eukprot:NODE_7040_length_465_cov_214.092683.p2 GENE.NODE_7040_length_465_cov_214.092683~~NODE_7040_length_465_cov_214.092683.p2  ORF type:complete len:95 (-),score=48.66 NODE_7040_length_465_cov_214.092683:163-447(-)
MGQAEEAARAAEEKLAEFLSRHKFTGINEKRKTGTVLTKTTYAIHVAVAEGNLEAVQLLVERKADLSQKDGNGKTAMQLAAKSGNAEIGAALER